MCGIVGLVRWNGLAGGDAERIERAARTLIHRGPDSEGFWRDTHCALGFRRLKVIDLSPAAEQPMANEDGALHVVFNGEIYNFRALRSELEQAGHTFASQSDTEVLLHGYEQWGLEPLLERLRGMFAFALWDARERRLVLARDPIGVKPLYFAERGDALLFASEPKALFASGLVEPELDPVALHEALTYRYVPPPRSGFKDVEKLPPGHCAEGKDAALRYRSWWTLKANSDVASLAREGEELRMRSQPGLQTLGPFELKCHHALAEAFGRRTNADVPKGVWLSGGLDSSLVAALYGAGSSTFAAGFALPEWDERPLARMTAEHLHTQHTDFEVPPDVFKLLQQIVWHADEPYFDSSCLPTYVLAERTKAHATVVQSGDGGDEAFAGYQRYVGMKHYRNWMRLPRWLRAGFVKFAHAWHPVPSRQGWDRLVRWMEKLRKQEASNIPAYVGAQTLFEQEAIRGLYSDELAAQNAELDGREYLANALKRAAKALYPNDEPSDHLSEVGVLQRADLATYLPGDVLHKVDRMSMAHGLEVRSPFLDVDLIELALSIPDEVRMPGRETKPLLRKLATQRVPEQVVRSAKRGFGVPLDDWFRGPLQKVAADLFHESRLVGDGLFRSGYWEPFWKAHQERQDNHGERLYALLATELWYRTFLDGAPAGERPAPLA
ncbi:MAG: asparagine synthetase B [Planctomycetota bacterium]